MILDGEAAAPLEHKDHVGMPTDIGMYCDRKAEVIIFSVEIIEVISPQIFDVSWIHPSM